MVNWLNKSCPAREDWYAVVDLLYEGKLLLQYRPPRMENFSIHEMTNLPKDIAERLEAKSRELDRGSDHLS